MHWQIGNTAWKKFKAYETQKQAEHALIQFRKSFYAKLSPHTGKSSFKFKLMANGHEIPVL